MPTITEIAPDIFRISTYVPEAELQFNQFVVRDDQPLLFHTGQRMLFKDVVEAVSGLLDPSTLKWIASSHFEADECGALNLWLQVAPEAVPACSVVASAVSFADFADRKPRPIENDEVLVTGSHRLKFLATPQVPHAWDTGLLFEETSSTLLCSDMFHQIGDVEPVTSSDVVGRSRQAMMDYQKGPYAYYFPYTPWTEPTLERLAQLQPNVCATMHGSTFVGDGARALREFGVAMRETLGGG